MKRRGFLKTAGAGVVAMAARGANRVHGANSRVNVALVKAGKQPMIGS